MPLYNYKCECGKECEEFRSMDDRDNEVVCKCGKKMKRDVANNVAFFCAYSPGHPRWFRGKREYGSRKKK
jgi:putative FmdB family regulatory protein